MIRVGSFVKRLALAVPLLLACSPKPLAGPPEPAEDPPLPTQPAAFAEAAPTSRLEEEPDSVPERPLEDDEVVQAPDREPGGVPGGVPGGTLDGVPGSAVGGSSPGSPAVTGSGQAIDIKLVMPQAIYAPDPPASQLGASPSAADKTKRVAKVAFCISSSGKTIDVRSQTRSGDPIVDKVTRDTVKKWRFRPYMVDGKATKVCTNATFNITFK